jgi:hypothetical protein
VLVRSLLKAVEEFTQGTPQTDDITFIVVEKLPGQTRLDYRAFF